MTVATKFLVISDTHGFESSKEHGTSSSPLNFTLPKVDVVLHCGDLTQVGGKSEFRKALRMLGGIKAELKLVIAGNHDLELDPMYDPDERSDHAEALELFSGPDAIAAGVTYLQEGIHNFELSDGARFTVYASPYQPAFGDWAFGYEHCHDRFNLAKDVAEGCTSVAENPVPDDSVDIMMTHGPPKGILDAVGDKHFGCSNLLQAVARAKPLLHCFGHIHESYGFEMTKWPSNDAHVSGKQNTISIAQTNSAQPAKVYDVVSGKSTLMVNAALQTGPSEWQNAPWCVELLLPTV